MSTICIIPARGGSQRIPRKNIKDFHGKPIIAYSIEKAQASGLFSRIIVSTDDVEISKIAKEYGAEVWRRRDPSLVFAGTQEVVADCINGKGILDYDHVCCLYATAPLMDVADLLAGYVILSGWRGDYVEYVMSAGYPPLQDAAQFYWGMAFSFKGGSPLITKHTRLIHVDASRVCDINTPEDWARAEQMYEVLNPRYCNPIGRA